MSNSFEKAVAVIAPIAVVLLICMCSSTINKTRVNGETLTTYVAENDTTMDVYINGINKGEMEIAPDDIKDKYIISDIDTEADTLYLKTLPRSDKTIIPVPMPIVWH